MYFKNTYAFVDYILFFALSYMYFISAYEVVMFKHESVAKAEAKGAFRKATQRYDEFYKKLKPGWQNLIHEKIICVISMSWCSAAVNSCLIIEFVTTIQAGISIQS